MNEPLVPAAYLFSLNGVSYRVHHVVGEEALSKPFWFELSMVVEQAEAFEPDDVVKAEATLEIERGGTIRRLTGIVMEASVEYTHGSAPLLFVRFEHRLALTRYRRDIQLFREQTGLDSAEEVLGTLGIGVQLRLAGSYPSRHYCVQFRETDDHFIHRMLEEEGVFYFLTESGEMVWGDHARAYEPLPEPLPVLQQAGISRHATSIWGVGEDAHTSVSQVTLRDWNFETPSLDMDVSAPGPCDRGVEQYDFPGEYDTPAAGSRIADLMAQAHARAAHRFTATSNETLLAPGRVVVLADPPPGAPQGPHVVRSVRHDWQKPGPDVVFEISLMEAELVYRPERSHPEPIMTNPLTGFVVGPGDIHTETYGRVKVHFHWDRKFPADDSCSWWVPVLQDNTSDSSSIPRTGWEVLVHFMEGDPDRPIALGRVYNAEDTFPTPLPKHKEQTRLRSLSSPTPDGFNEIRFDDLTEREQLYHHAERDQTVKVANDRTEDVLGRVASDVHRDDALKIGSNQTITVNENSIGVVQKNETATIGGNRDRSVGGVDVGTTNGNRTLTIGGDHVVFAGAADSNRVKLNLTQTVASAHLEASLHGSTVEASRLQFVNVGGLMLEVARHNKGESAVRGRVETIGGLVLSKAGGEHTISSNKTRVTTVGGLMYVSAQEQLSLTGREGYTATSSVAHHNADVSATLRVGETSIEMKDGVIRMNAPEKISMVARADNDRATGNAADI